MVTAVVVVVVFGILVDASLCIIYISPQVKINVSAEEKVSGGWLIRVCTDSYIG